MTDTDTRLTDLESRLAFMDDTLDQLNAIVTEQADEISALQRENRALRERLLELAEWAQPDIENTRPPHY